MTLHIAFVCGAFALTVGDRILTQRVLGSGAVREWDALANKTVFVEAVNGQVVISYAGLAHVDGLPTDEWLIRTITQEVPVEGPRPGSRPLRIGPPLQITLGQVFERIERGLAERLPQQRFRKSDRLIEILIAGAGWPKRPGRPRPFIRRIMHRGATGAECEVWRGRLGGSTTWSPAPHWLASGVGRVRRSYFESIPKEIQRSQATEEDVEAAIARIIRRAAAAKNSTIGTDLMAVYLPFQEGRNARARFLWDAHRGTPVDAFTPGVVAGGVIAYPARFSAGFSMHVPLRFGAFRTEVRPALPPQDGGYWRSQVRPSAP